MSEYNESFDEFIDESLNTSPRKSPLKVFENTFEEEEEISYGDESFEPPSPVKQPTSTQSFQINTNVQVFWQDECEWFRGVIKQYDKSRGYFIRYEDGDEQWEESSNIKLVQFDMLPDVSKSQSNDINLPTTNANRISHEAENKSMQVLNKIITPRPYAATAEHYTTVKFARPYKSSMCHPSHAIDIIIPRQYQPVHTEKCMCPCMHHNVLLACTPPSAPLIYGKHPSEHRFLHPNVHEQETQTCQRPSNEF